jgi:acetolactate synthase-1/2/3 large subunit
MALVTGGELVVRALQKAGVETVFGLHGAHIDTIFQACLDHDLPIIDTRHEAAAGHAAEGYARIGRRLGVALVTAGGGLTNAITPIANASIDRTPVLFLTGSGMLRDDETNTLQAGIDQVAIATPITKWAHRITNTDHIPRLVAQAIRIAMAAPCGPVLLDLPWDVLMNEVEEDDVVPSGPGSIRRGGVQAEDIDLVLDILATASRPVIIVGSEASRSDNASALRRLAEVTGVPVFADYEGLNLLSALPDALDGGLIQGLYGFEKAKAAPDAVLMLGTRFGLNTGHGSGTLVPHGARIVQIDPDAREIGRLQSIELGIVADVSAAIEALAAAAERTAPPDRSTWQLRVRELIDRRYDLVFGQVSQQEGDALHPLTASAVVASHVSADAVVVADGALAYLWLSEVISKARPAGFLCHGYLGSMGVGFGVAIGAQTAAKQAGRRTILVTGDGSVGYSIAEFDTAVRHRLPLIVVVMNNRSWGATLHFQKLAVGPNRITNTRLENGRYHDVAAAFEANSYIVADAEGLDAALTDALAKDQPACINVMIGLDPIPPEELILIGMDPFQALTPENGHD